MAVSITVPSLGESITEAAIEKWLKNPGERVEKDEPLVSIESDKATVEVPSPVAGVVAKHLRAKGDRVKIGEPIAEVEEGGAAAAAPAPVAAAPAHAASASPAGPAARRLAAESGVPLDAVAGTGPGGRILKEDVAKTAAAPAAAPAKLPAPPPVAPRAPAGAREEQIVPMSPMRKTIAARLVLSKQTTAQLTTFNEVDLTRVMELRAKYQPKFTEKYGIKLGMMSFFLKGAIEALKLYPQVNSEIRGDDVVYKSFYDIGVAVGSGKGLTVPIIRDADRLSFSELELTIADFGKRAQENKLKLDELQGGTFTVSNGGVYGSLMSTPILNPPQVGILGMHNIVKRPVVVDDQIVIRPMMYLALSYDHRIIDGREAVQFLIRIKDCVENPERLLLEV